MYAQNKMTPEQLWQLGRVDAEILTPEGQVVYGVTRYDATQNTSSRNLYSMALSGGLPRQLTTGGGANVQALPGGRLGFEQDGQWWEMNADGSGARQQTHEQALMSGIRMSPDGKHILFTRRVKAEKVSGADFYPDLPKSRVQIYTDLMYRHWDTWSDGTVSHLFYAAYADGKVSDTLDLMEGEPWSVADYRWSPDGGAVVYVAKKKKGKAAALSTNTDIYRYNPVTGTTENLSEKIKGGDGQPAFSPDGRMLAWTSMKTDGYESDKNDLVVMDMKSRALRNLTAAWDGTVSSFRWSEDGKSLFFTAPVDGTMQLLRTGLQGGITPVASGDFDINGILGQQGDTLVLKREDFNHAAELYVFSLKHKQMRPLTTVNREVYEKLPPSRTEKRRVKTSDGKEELVWVIYPPGFDATRKYPALLYCQGGPQVALTQFYSYRWNLQLMAAQGYIVIAPNRRGMPGYGVKWNEAISKDWGGQPIRDYISAVDDLAREPYVDKDRIACVGASYGGYSTYLLAGLHPERFRTFIAHDGLFDLKSWYGTTEEMWFANYDIGGPYWEKDNKAARRSYQRYSPSDYVTKWKKPILIIQGGIDFRVPVEQGLQAFQAAQLQGIKSKLLYFPEENHWVLHAQNALVWQHEFFKWLEETL
ncbi:S9 family peptidase [Compostibacter hankyongensis]|uniref:S9 family peptidase n=2 Tax=Compostibacter hankyongensis TaxID=1007089 RepID=A0ABP8FCG9_9BACT